MNFSVSFDQVKKWCLGINSLDEAEHGIRRDGLVKAGLKTWSKRVGGITLALGVFCVLGAAGVLLAPAAIAACTYLALKGATYLVDRDINNKLAAAHELAAKEAAEAPPAPAAKQPQPKPGAKVTGAFNATVPANDTAEKPARSKAVSDVLKKFGLDKYTK